MNFRQIVLSAPHALSGIVEWLHGNTELRRQNRQATMEREFQTSEVKRKASSRLARHEASIRREEMWMREQNDAYLRVQRLHVLAGRGNRAGALADDEPARGRKLLR